MSKHTQDEIATSTTLSTGLVEEKVGYKETKLGLIPEDWSVCTFRDIADKNVKWSITGGPFGSDLKAEHYKEEGIRIIQLQNIGDGEFRNKSKIYTSLDKADQLLACNIFPGEIILSKMGDPVARACKIPNTEKRWLMGSDGIRLVIDESQYDKRFVLDYINYSIFRKLAISRSTGSTRRRIGLVDLKKIPFVKLPLPEQQKIASILNTWDKAIAAQEKLIAQKQALKKGLMQQLLTGKKRFIGFEEKWNKTELKEIGTIIRGASPRPKGDPRYYGGNVPRLMVKDVTRDGKYVTPKIDFLTEAGASKSRPCKAGTLTIVCSGDVGVPSFLAVDACIHDGFLAIIDIKHSLIDSDFLYYQLKRLRARMERSATHGGVFTNLTTTILKDFIIEIPPLKEQLEIINVLAKADREVNKLEMKLEKIISQKQGLLQQLLTGEKRVKI